jgi:hypothetical protein
VAERVDWECCLFRDDGSLDVPDVHDNFVYALAVHLEQRVLILHTQYRDGSGPYELTDVRFVGLVAHHIDDVAEPSILLDIELVSAEWVVEQSVPHRLADYFADIRIVSESANESRCFLLVFRRLPDSGRFWKDMMVHLLQEIESSPEKPSLELESKGEMDPAESALAR